MSTMPAALHGREAELRALSESLDATVRGTGQVALVEGEAGIGKTRLLDELSDRAAELGVQVRRGSAEELEQERPFGSLLDALGPPDGARVFGGRGPTTADARFLAQDAFVDHVERLTAAGPVLLAVDDQHWADRSTLATLWALARRSTDLGLLLVLAFRPTPQSADLARVLDGCRSLDAHHLRVGPIDDDALAELAAEVVGAPPGRSLREELRGTGGNPFLAIEVLRALQRDDDLIDVDGTWELRAGSLPPLLRETLIRRLTTLSDNARQVLSVAAVLAGVGRVDDLATLLAISPAAAGAAVAEATRAGLFEPAGAQLTFRHDLIREALYQDLPETVRSEWHRAAARCLEGRAEPAVVARHLALGATSGDADAVAGLASAAAEIAAREPDAAAELLERALEFARDPGTRPDLGVARASALLAAGRAQEAMTQADSVLTDRFASPTVVARAHIARANAAFHQGRPTEAVEGFAAALASGVLDETATAYALAHEAVNRVWTFELDAALDQAARALAEGRRLGITAVQVEALSARCTALGFQAHVDAAVAAGREAVELAGEDPTCLRRAAHVALGLALLAADRLDDARSVTEEGRRLATQYGQVLLLRNYSMTLARIAWFAGRWDDAVAEADTAARFHEDFGMRFGLVGIEGTKGLAAFHRGDHAAARVALERQPPALKRGPDDSAGSELAVLLRAELLEAGGRPEEAAATLLDHFEDEGSHGMNMARHWPAPTCVRLAVAVGEMTAARDVTTELEAVAERAGTTSSRAVADFARGLVENDAECLTKAVEGFATVGRPLDHMGAIEALAAMHAAAGAREESIECLRDAARLADALGAAHDARRITASLRDLGVRAGSRARHRRATEGWDALTDSERDVARLVDAGLRNAEIAEQLFISRRTVEYHVSRLYAKLGAENRVALARTIRQQTEHGAA